MEVITRELAKTKTGFFAVLEGPPRSRKHSFMHYAQVGTRGRYIIYSVYNEEHTFFVEALLFA